MPHFIMAATTIKKIAGIARNYNHFPIFLTSFEIHISLSSVAIAPTLLKYPSSTEC